VQRKALSASSAETSSQERREALPLLPERQQSEPLELRLGSQSDPTFPPPGRPLPVVERAEQPSPRESLAKRQAALVSLLEVEAQPLAWLLQWARWAEPEPLPLPSFG